MESLDASVLPKMMDKFVVHRPLRAMLLIGMIVHHRGHYCALEGEECSCFGDVTYGPLQQNFTTSIVKQVSGKVRCDNAAMGGDPSPLVRKVCICDSAVNFSFKEDASRGDIESVEIACNGVVNSSRKETRCFRKHRRHGSVTHLREGYRCANEGGYCECEGDVYFGELSTTKPALHAVSSSMIRCDTQSLGGDPAPGSKRKVCTCKTSEKASLPPEFKLRVIWIGEGKRGSLEDVISLFREAFNAYRVDRIAPIVFEKDEECGFTLPYQRGVAGVTAAHREAWKSFLGCPLFQADLVECDAQLMSCYFAQRQNNCMFSDFKGKSEWAVILEDDALIPPYAALNRTFLVDQIRRQFALALRDRSDLFYLGFCGEGNVHAQYMAKNWLCTHAYAVTPHAARLLLRWATVECDPARKHKIHPTTAVDWLMNHFCNKKYRKTFAHNAIPTSAKLSCSGVDHLPALFSMFPKNFAYKTNTRGFFVQSKNDSLRKIIDKSAPLLPHPPLTSRELRQNLP